MCFCLWACKMFNLFLVVWNPWIEQSKEISDFGDDEYPNMVCVEAGHVSSPVVLLPGTAFEASQILQVRYLTISDFIIMICILLMFALHVLVTDIILIEVSVPKLMFKI